MAPNTYHQPVVASSAVSSTAQVNTQAKSSQRQPSRNRYRPEIDGLRAIAVIAVIINHFNPNALPGGFLGVDIFFVISGFVVTSSLAGKPDKSWREYLLSFYSRRVKRLIPALVFCVVVTSLLGCLFIDADLTQSSLRTGLFSLFGGSNWYILRQRTDYFGQAAELNLFTQTWSLGVEEQFYLVFPVLLGLCGYSRRYRPKGPKYLFRAVLCLSAASLAFYLYLAAANPASAFFLMPARFWELGVGCLIFLAGDRLSAVFSKSVDIRQRKTEPPAILTPVCILLLLGTLFISKDFQTFSTLASAGLTTVLLWSFSRKDAVVRLLSSKWMIQIGLLSYSLYLWHWSVIVLSRWTVGISKWTIPFQLLAMVGLALFSNKFIEKPLRYASWSQLKTRTIAYGLTATVASAGLLVALGGPLSGSLYTGKSYPLAYTSSFQLADNYQPCSSAAGTSSSFSECSYPNRQVSTSSLERNSGAVFKGTDTRRTDTRKINTRKTIYFVGDSHTGSLQSLASSLVKRKDVPRISMVERDGCLFSSSLYRVDTDGASCLASNRSFLSKVMETGQPGDVVVVTNRHSLYFLSPNARDDILKLEKGMFAYSLKGQVLSQQQALEIYTQNLVDISKMLAEKDISLVAQAPLPDWKYPPSQCQPQWFRPSINLPADCELDVVEERRSRTALIEAFRQMEAASPNLYVYDPFSAFCNAEGCSPFASDGTPLFRDANHLNDYGAEHLYVNFRRYLVSNSLIQPGEQKTAKQERSTSQIYQ